MKHATLVAAIINGLLISQSFGQSEIIVLEPSAETTIEGEIDGVSEENLEDSRLLLKFNFSSLPDGARIQYAGLILSDEMGLPWNIPHVPVLAGVITDEWDESSASWDGPSNGESWNSPGGDWDPAVTSYKVLVRDARTPGKIVITDMARKWLSGSKDNNGIIVMVVDPAEVTDALNYFNLSALTPRLQIRYFLPDQDAEIEG